MTDELDEDGQPVAKGYNWNRIKDSRMDELIGICRGVLADGAVVFEEACFLRDWLSRNKQVRHSLAGKMLDDLLARVLADGVVDPNEEEELVVMLSRIIGGTPDDVCDASYSSTLPLDDPAPKVIFEGMAFCFTGKFQYGARKKCQEITEKSGGVIHKSPNKSTNFVVIGEIGSRDWAHSTGGRKIENAIRLREEGNGVCIVSEAHWCSAISGIV